MMKNNKGFTLIELLLVVVIIGLMLAVIVPRVWRANIDSKYGLVRQNCSELASFAQEWTEGQLLAQNATVSTAMADSYYATLTGVSAWTNQTAAWIALQTGTTNWGIAGAGGLTGQSGSTAGEISVTGRWMDATKTGTGTVPETVVEGIIPPEKVLRNPFNEANVFQRPNDPIDAGAPVTGAIAFATITEQGGGGTNDLWHYYAFLYQGTDSTTRTLTTGGNATATTFYAGQDLETISGMRNGIFAARLR